MRYWTGLAAASLSLSSLAQAQRFGFTHSMLPADADNTRAVALGDVDGDGDLDAFVGNYSEQNRLYLNDGTGVFTDVTVTSLPALSDSTRAVALGDVDGDGDLDAFVGNLTNLNRLHLNSGTGVFTDVSFTNLPALGNPSTSAVALGDVDGDGDLDAFVGRGGQDRLHLNGGTGVFTDVTAANLPALSEQTQAVALGDVDGDGDLDAFEGNYGGGLGGQERLLLNGGTGVFTDVTATNLPALFDWTQAVALVDVDGDGDLDAFVGNSTNSEPDRLHLNDGTGVFTDVTATNLPPLFENTYAVAFGDVDGDGDLDAFVGNVGVPSLNRLYLNGGTGVFTNVTATNLPALNPYSTQAIALGDVDGDGDLDAFLGNNGLNRLYLNGGTGFLTDVTATNLPGVLAAALGLALGDVDADGDLDAFMVNTGLNRLYVNAGTGVFTDVTATNLPPLIFNTHAVALGDVDGDGDLDALLGNWNQQERLYLNDGTGDFTDVTATGLPFLLDLTTAVALGDLDGDGDLDAFVGNYDQQDRLYLNGGTGVFTNGTATNLPAMVDPTTTVALGDMDGDGDLDAFVGNKDQFGPGEQNRLYLNGGTGVFIDVTATNLPALLVYTTAVALGDLDGDGDLDAFMGNFDDSGPDDQDFLYLNSGTGVFTDVTATNLPTLLDHTAAVALGDVDGDGDLDAFVGNHVIPFIDDGQDRLYLNGGTGVFTDVTATDLPALLGSTIAVALGDLDGDGDLDALEPTRLFTNLTRQVAWRGIPRVGKPLVLDLRGPANGFWVLGASLASASIPLFPLGTLRLDPATLIVAGGGALDPQGRASLSVLVPPIPALVGLSLYWQAGVGPPPSLTNLEITTATDL